MDLPGVSNEAKSSDEEEVIEPRFKYERILGDVVKKLERDSATCIVVHDKFLAIGFSSGRIGFFDHLGNAHFESRIKSHRCSVSHIAVDAPGTYIISCANDKQVCIQGFGHSDYNQAIDVFPAAKCAALSEDFSKYGSGQRFVTAGQTLILHEKGFFGKQKTVLYQGLERDGLISMCTWKSSLIAFTNDTGTRIYDCKLKRLITLIQSCQQSEAKTLHFPPRHIWIDSLNLIIACGNTISICHVTTQAKDNDGLPYKKVEILYQWIIPDFYICGISYTVSDSPLVCEQLWDEIVLFGFSANEQNDSSEVDNTFDETRSVFSDISAFSALNNVTQDGRQIQAQFMLLKAVSMTQYVITSEDLIEMKNVDIRLLKRFFLCSLPQDSIYFLLGTRELIEAKKCSVDDRVGWLLENDLYEEALQCALKDPDSLVEISVADIGRRLINELIKKEEFAVAASHLNEVCGRNKHEWEYYCEAFEKHGEILKLVPYIPTSLPQLEPECYEWILTAALYARTKLLRKLVHEWNPDIYRAASIIDKIMKRMVDDNLKSAKESPSSKEDLINLYQSLAYLLAYVRNFPQAIRIYLELKDKAIFGIINRYNLFYLVKDRIVELMQIDEDLARTILIENADSIPIQQVVTQLSKHPKLQMLYLNKLHARGEAQEYSDLMIKLFAEYDRKMLMPFLKKCENYKLDQALDVCKRKNYIEEMVYLLGRSGNRLEALDVIMTKMGHIDAAISFCTEHEDDIELWNRLVDLAMQKSEHITKLLLTAGPFIDPLIVIKKIPTDIEIPGLQKALQKILRDYEMQINLLRDSSKVGLDDLVQLFDKRVKNGLSSVFVGSDQKCSVCSESFVGENADSKTNRDILFLGCGHVFHQNCIEFSKPNEFTCPSCFLLCSLDQGPGSSRQSPQKTSLPNSISQANLNPFFDDYD